jgi:hypothetical protein
MTKARKTVADSPAPARAKPNEHGQLSFTSPKLGASVFNTEGCRHGLEETPGAADCQSI